MESGMEETPYGQPSVEEGSQKTIDTKLMFFRLGLVLVGLALVAAVIAVSADSDQQIRLPERGPIFQDMPGPAYSDSDLFSQLMYLIAIILAFGGASVLALFGFLILVTGTRDSHERINPDELLGDARPAKYRRGEKASPSELRRLDLRTFWSPCLAYMVAYTVYQIVLKVSSPLAAGADRLPELWKTSLGILHFGAFLLYIFFWLAGVLRINRAGLEVEQKYYVWAAMALLAFSVPAMM